MLSITSYGTSASLLTLVALLFPIIYGSPISPPPTKSAAESNLVGLYEANGKVHILTYENFNDTVVQQNRSVLVEFYNAFCGHCQRYAPFYKNLAETLYPWRETVLVAAIDCNAMENTGICRDYEIFGYPTLRYFSPYYKCKEGSFGQDVNPFVDLNELIEDIARRVAAENHTDSLTTFPKFHSVTEQETADSGIALFNGLDSNRKYVILVYEPVNKTYGLESCLEFHLYPDVQVRRITDLHVANKFQIDGKHYKIATVDRRGNVVPYSVPTSYMDTIRSFLDAQHFKPRNETIKFKSVVPVAKAGDNRDDGEAIISQVLRNKHLVYQADLEMAIRQILFNEIPKVSEMFAGQLLAAQNMLSVLHNYHPLGAQGDEVIRQLKEFALNENDTLLGENFDAEVKRLNQTHGPIFSSNQFVGCVASEKNKRGYTCSLWTLFHYLTVQAERSHIKEDPLEVLTAIYGYIKYFFGCTHCSRHFVSMAQRRKIWQVSSKSEAVLWLWEAHNEVNERLAGDQTEDPKFPKIQFPSISSCAQCRKSNVTAAAAAKSDDGKPQIDWNRDAVFNFLKNIHNPAYISRYGVENESVLYPSLEKIRQKRMIGKVFSEMDMRMSIFVYMFCIIMMVVAFKVFVLKGYRKKPYMHDVLGKV